MDKFDTRSTKFSDWFDPNQPLHIDLYVKLRETGIIPREKLPRGVYFDYNWLPKIEEKIVRCFVKSHSWMRIDFRKWKEE